MALTVGDLLTKLKKKKKEFLDSTTLDEKIGGAVSRIDQDQSMPGTQIVPGGIKAGIQRVTSTPKSDFNIFSQRSMQAGLNAGENLYQRTNNPVVRTGISAGQSLINNYKSGFSNIGQGVQNRKPGQVVTGAYQTVAPSVALAGGVAPALAMGGFGGAISAGMAKLSGQDPSRAAGKGFVDGLKTRAVTRFTDPVISKAVGGIGGNLLQKQLAQRGVSAVGNLIEDEIIAKFDGLKSTNQDRALSLIIGAATAGNLEISELLRGKITRALKPKAPSRLKKQVVNEVSQYLRDTKGRFTKTPQLPEKPGFIGAGGNFVDTTKPPRINEAAYGAIAGIEPERDENGKLTGKVDFNTGNAAIGVAGLIGGRKAINYADSTKFSSMLDQKPRFEIDDSGAKLKNIMDGFDLRKITDNGEKKVNLEEILDHPELFKKYPQLKKYKFEVDKNIGANTVGRFDSENKTITFPATAMQYEADIKSTLLHEIQHAIQEIEGFARGGSPASAKSYSDFTPEKIKLAELKDQLMSIAQKTGDTDLVASGFTQSKNPAIQDKIREVTRLEKLVDDTPFDSYKRLSGELEARAVQRRMDMPMDQRLKTDPYADEAIATTGTTNPNNFITRFDSGVQASQPTKGVEAQPIKLYKGVGGDAPNINRMAYGSHYADNPKLASQYGKVIEETIPANAKIADLDVIKQQYAKQGRLASPELITKDLIEQGYTWGKGSLPDGQLEYVKLSLPGGQVASAKGWTFDSEDPNIAWFKDGKTGISPNNKNEDLYDLIHNDKIISTFSTGSEAIEYANKNILNKSVDPLEALKTEARKYKSAEEFVKVQGSPVYHGTNATFKVFDKSKIGSATDDGIAGKGFYFTTNKKFANDYAKKAGGGIVMETYIPTKEIFDLSDIKTARQASERFNMPEGDFVVTGGGTVLPKNFDIARRMGEKIEKMGYAGASFKRYSDTVETVIFDPSKIKTKSQLTDIYNQAKGTKPKIKVKALQPTQKQLVQLIPLKKSKQVSQQPDQNLSQSFGQVISSGKNNIGKQSPSQSLRKSSYDQIIQQAKNAIGGDNKKVKGIKQSFDDFYTDWVNRFHPIEKLATFVEKTKKVSIIPKNNPTIAIKRLLGAGGTAELRHRQQLDPIIKKLDKTDISDFDVFLKAKRDIELSGRNIIGSDKKQAESVIEALSQKHDIKKFNDIAEELYSYQRQGLDKLKQAGFLSDEAIKTIQKQNQKYVPFTRVMDEVDDYIGLPTSKAQQTKSPVDKIKGSKKNIESPIESIIANTYKIESAVAKNRVAQSIANLNKIMPELNIKKVSKSGSDTISVWEDGKKTFYQVPQDVADSVKGINEESTGKLFEILAAPAKILRQQATGRNLEFMLPNVIRDQFEAATNSKYGYKPFIDYINGLRHLINYNRKGSDDVVEGWLKSGGGIFFENMAGRKSIKEEILDATKKKGIAKKLTQWVISGFDTIGEYSEKPTRIGLYKRALDATGNKYLAANEAREGTLDFARMGAKMKVANSLIPFLNVEVQGFDRWIRTFKDQPKKAALKLLAYGSLPATMTALYNNVYHPEAWQRIPDFVKDGNFVIITSDEGEDGNPRYITIPKAHIVKLASNPVEELITYFAGNSPRSFKQFAFNFFADSLPLLEGGDNVKEVLSKSVGGNLPQFMKIPAQAVSNHDFFRNQEIVPWYLKNKPPAEQAYKSTDGVYKYLGNVLNTSPLMVKNVAENTLAGGVKQPEKIVKTIQMLKGDKEFNPNDVFVGRRFYGGYADFDNDRPEDSGNKVSFIQRLLSPTKKAEAIDSIEPLPSGERLENIYSNSKKTIDSYQKKKDEILFSSKDEDARDKSLKTLEENYQNAQKLLERIGLEKPEQIQEIELSSGIKQYKSGSSATVEERANWIKLQLEGKSEEERQKLLNRLWDEKVLTSGSNGTAELVKELGMNPYSYTGTKRIKLGKKGKKASIRKVKINLSSTASKPNLMRFTAPKIELPQSQVVRFNAPKTPRVKFNIQDTQRSLAA